MLSPAVDFPVHLNELCLGALKGDDFSNGSIACSITKAKRYFGRVIEIEKGDRPCLAAMPSCSTLWPEVGVTAGITPGPNDCSAATLRLKSC